jgi:hypothetical protein
LNHGKFLKESFMPMSKVLTMVLALTVVLLIAGAGLAQTQGSAPAAGPGSQMCTGGPGGVCTIAPPANPGTQDCPTPGAGKGKKRQGARGPKGGAQGNQTGPQTVVPQSGQ